MHILVNFDYWDKVPPSSPIPSPIPSPFFTSYSPFLPFPAQALPYPISFPFKTPKPKLLGQILELRLQLKG